MLKWLLRALGIRALRTAVHGGSRPPILDFGLGISLLRDRRVPVRSKATALLLGFGALMVLNVLELPVEALIAVLLNVPGIGLDVMINGIELLAGPILFGALFVIRLAPPDIVAQLRLERNGIPVVTQPTGVPPRHHNRHAFRRL